VEPDAAAPTAPAPAAPAPAVSDESRRPETPGRLGLRPWLGALGRTVAETRRDNVTDLAAGLTYYSMLSIFPMLLAVVSVLGLIGDSATQPLLDHLGELAPGPARDIVTTAVENLERSQGSAGVLFLVSLATALWSASRYVAAFMRASNVVYEVDEGRPLWKKLPVRLAITVVVALVLVVSTATVVLTGDLARQAGDLVGLGSTAVTAWNIAKWPATVLVVGFLFALLYWAAPNVRHPGFRWLVPGAFTAVLIWIAASVGFTLYVANFGSYNATYGALGGVIAFLVWLWIANVAVLLGAELNAELERGREIAHGFPPDQEPFLHHRDTAKLGHGP
jgi:membrane protein